MAGPKKPKKLRIEHVFVDGQRKIKPSANVVKNIKGTVEMLTMLGECGVDAAKAVEALQEVLKTFPE
jgi:hypothetical protein